MCAASKMGLCGYCNPGSAKMNNARQSQALEEIKAEN